MDEATQEAEPFSNVAAILQNFFPRGSAVNGQKFPYVRRLREKVGCVADPWDLYDYSCLTIENVLRPK